MRVAVGFPWRYTDARADVFSFVWEWWERLLPDSINNDLMFSADTSHQIFNLNACRNTVVEQARLRGADVVVICDADVILSDPTVVHRAIDWTFRSGKMTKPYKSCSYLNKAETEALMRGESWVPDRLGHNDGCCYIVTPEGWDRMYGADERFIGYGGDDLQIVMCAETYIGIQWYEGYAWSLWHADENRPIGSPAQQRNHRLAQEYLKRRGKRFEMNRFIRARRIPWEGQREY